MAPVLACEYFTSSVVLSPRYSTIHLLPLQERVVAADRSGVLYSAVGEEREHDDSNPFYERNAGLGATGAVRIGLQPSGRFHLVLCRFFQEISFTTLTFVCYSAPTFLPVACRN
jgi:hypothetical protein